MKLYKDYNTFSYNLSMILCNETQKAPRVCLRKVLILTASSSFTFEIYPMLFAVKTS